MKENGSNKIVKTILSLVISFLIIFIVAMFARSFTNNILPSNSKVAVFINDYLDMMMQKMDGIALKMRIKRNTVSQYQVDLISQSISDYVGYSMYQSAEALKSYNPNNPPKGGALEKYKSDYYKMTLENPYLRGMTVFNSSGKMMLNLYLSGNKSWPLELQPPLIEEIKKKRSIVLNATNENSFYIMEHIKNKYGDIIVVTRNDYAYVSDIAMYYQVADKNLYVSDSKNSTYNVKETLGTSGIEKVSSVINRYAYYKKQPSFVVNNALSVSLIGKEYPNYFELIVLAITALFIVVFQFIIRGVINFFSYLLQVQKKRANSFPLPKGDVPMIDDDIIKVDIPKSSTFEENPPIIQKVFHKIPDDYIKKDEDKDENMIENNILNLVSAVKEEIESYNSIRFDKTNEKDNVGKDSLEYNETSGIDKSATSGLESLERGISDEKELDKKVIIGDDRYFKTGVEEKEISIDYDKKGNESIELKEKELIYETSNNVNTFKNDGVSETVREKENDILLSYESVINKNDDENHKKESVKKASFKEETVSSRTDDVFSSFDKMLASIIDKAESEARDAVSKKG